MKVNQRKDFNGLFDTHKITKKIDRSSALVIVFFLAFLIFGCLVFDDYGISVDEMSQRGHSLLNYKFLVPSVSDIATFAVDFPSMGDLRDSQSFYGVAVQLPVVLVEHMTGFLMPFKTIFLLRHFYTFLLFFLSSICFYKCCRLFTENRWLALLGTAIYILSPRTLADSFYNIKDLMALSLCMITVCFGCRLLRDMKKRDMVCFAFFGALGTNSRIVLAVVIAAFLFAAFVQGIVEKQIKKRFLICLGVGCLSLLFYFIMTPGIWANTLQNVKQTVDTFSNYTVMPGTSVYQGSTVTGNELRRSYVFVWMLITIPIVYLVFSAAGAACSLWQMVKLAVHRQGWGWVQYAQLAVFLIAAVPLGYVILVKPVIYNGWRHFYFMYSAIAMMAFFGLLYWEEWSISRGRLIWAGRLLLIGEILCTAVWVGINHPYEYVYFNLFARNHVENNYDRDYWGMSTYQALQYICETDDSSMLHLYAYNGFSKLFLPDEDWSRTLFVDEGDADYIIENYQNGADTGKYQKYYYYDKVHEFMVDGFPVCTVYKSVYREFDSQSMYQDKETGRLIYPVNRQEISWTQEIAEDKAVFTGTYQKAVPIDAFYADTSWEEIVPNTRVWLSEDGEDWLCINELEGSLTGQYAIMARLPETLNLKYVRIDQERLHSDGGQEDYERYALLHFQLYRSRVELEPELYAVSPFKRVAGHENPANSFVTLDGDPITRWETERNQTAQMIYDMVLDDVYPVAGVRLDCGVTGEDYARKLRVFLSEDNETWTEADVYTEDNERYYFSCTPGRYIRLMTGDPGEELDCVWAIAELEVLVEADAQELN